MTRRLGVAVNASVVRAVLVEGGAVLWAGASSGSSADAIAETIGHLAAECGRPVRRARVVLERDLVQCRAVVPAPPIRGRSVRTYVELEAPRLFRNGTGPLVTDAALVPLGSRRRALWAAAAAEDLTRAIVTGCSQAGLRLEALGAACEVLPATVADRRPRGELALPHGTRTELLDRASGRVWRSRLLRTRTSGLPSWVTSLQTLGENATSFAAAYAAAIAMPRLVLMPPAARTAAALASTHRLYRVLSAAAAVWLLALGVFSARLTIEDRRLAAALAELGAGLDSALSVRRDLASARAAIAVLSVAERARPKNLALLAGLTTALGDSTVLVELRVRWDSTLHLAGYARSAAKVLADLESVAAIGTAKLDGPPGRETIGVGNGPPRTWDRFAITARLGAPR